MITAGDSVKCFAAGKEVQSAARCMAPALVIHFLDPRGAHVPQEWCSLAQQFFKVASSDRVSGVTQRTVSLWREVQRCGHKTRTGCSCDFRFLAAA